MDAHARTRFFPQALFFLSTLLLSSIPLIMDWQLHQLFSMAKAFYLKFGAGLLIFSWGIYLLNTRDEIKIAKDPLLYPIISFILFMGISTLLSFDPWTSWVGVHGRHFGFQGHLLCALLYFTLTSTASKNSHYKYILSFSFIVGTIIGIYSIVQFIGLDPFGLFRSPYQRTYSFTGNPNFGGNILASIFPLTFAYTYLTRKNFLKILYLFMGLCMLAGLLFTKTRGAYFSALITLICSLFLMTQYLSLENKTIHKKLISTFFLITFGVFFNIYFVSTLVLTPQNVLYPLIFLKISSYFYKPLQKYSCISKPAFTKILIYVFLSSFFISFFLFFNHYGQNNVVSRLIDVINFKTTIRYFLWRDSFEIIKEYPFFGTGPETYRNLFMPHKSLELAFYGGPKEHDNPHNNFLSIWATMGIFALMSYIWILYKVFEKSFKSLRANDHYTRVMAISFFSLMLAYFLWSIPAFDTVVNLPFFYLLLAAFTLWYRDISPPSYIIIRRPYLRTIFALILLPLSITSALVNFRIRESEKEFKRHVAAINKFHKFVKNKDLPRAEMAIDYAILATQRASAFNPEESFFHLTTARMYFQKAKMTKDPIRRKTYIFWVKRYLEKAHTHSWAPESILIEWLQLSLFQKNYSQAILRAEKALKQAPFRIDIRIILEKLVQKTKGYITYPEKIPYFTENSRIICKFKKNSLLSRIFYIELLIYQGKFPEALKSISDFRQDFPKNRNELMKLMGVWKKKKKMS